MTTKKDGRKLTPEDLLRDYHPEIQAISEALRSLVKNTVPEAKEKAYPGWRAIGYRHPSSGYFCGIFPFEKAVHLIFEWGILLPDPDEVLQAPEPRDHLAGGDVEGDASQEPDVDPQHPPPAQGELGEAVRPGEALDEGHGGRLPV